ncbi:hypothetical protein PITCH_A140006 [uncultured Desulfobacterium sp.]|uniref:Uncharacterized protein n=1 Tax=uncultured Desulfobacterium sp. TaxID=201089 RepID=A0A445MST6_9BACT|nr:hypothetical protein PITCH_A140006 [uncultured Desulfobacterium sp.]
MFPTYVGMNRHQLRLYVLVVNVPHVRGDEPETGQTAATIVTMFPTYVGMNRNAALYRM